MISNNQFGGNSQSFQQQQFGGQGYGRNRRQSQQVPSPTQLTGFSSNMQVPSQVNSFSATSSPNHQRVDSFGSSSGVNAFRAQPQPQFGAISASGEPEKSRFKGNQDFKGQDHLALRSQLQAGQVTFRGDGGAPYTSQSLYMMG